VADQIFGNADMIPGIAFLKIYEARLEYQIEARRHANPKSQDAQSGDGDPLPAGQQCIEGAGMFQVLLGVRLVLDHAVAADTQGREADRSLLYPAETAKIRI
jgi:hypothetical protein